MKSLDGPDAIEIAEIEEPPPEYFETPGSGVLIDVHAAGVAFPDLLMSRGGYQAQPQPPFTPGIEVAGTVLEASPDARVRIGDRVAAYMAFGGLAERAVAPAVATFPLPDELDFAAGAALVVNYHTAYFALVTRGRMRAGETVLVHGAAGGLGSAALQVAHGLGTHVIAVVSTEQKAKFAQRCAPCEVVYSNEDWPDQVRRIAGPRGIDVIFDPVGGDRVTPGLRLLRPDARYLIVGFTSGTIPTVKINRLLLSNTEVVGAGWGAYITAKPEAADPIGEAVNELIESGHVRPLIGARFELSETADAIRLIERREALGKVVVTVRG